MLLHEYLHPIRASIGLDCDKLRELFEGGKRAMPTWPCTMPTRRFTFKRSAALAIDSLSGPSQNVEHDLVEATKTVEKRLENELYEDMIKWLNENECESPCIMGLIHIGPPEYSPDPLRAEPQYRRNEVIGYKCEVTVESYLEVDCHRVPAGAAAKPKAGMIEVRLSGQHRGGG